MDKIFITITGTEFYYEMEPFELGEIIRLVKEPDNSYDLEAIKAELPFAGKIGSVANSYKTVVRGTMSAGRIYDKIGNVSYVKVIFITNNEIICEILNNEEHVKDIEILESQFEKWSKEEKLMNAMSHENIPIDNQDMINIDEDLEDIKFINSLNDIENLNPKLLQKLENMDSLKIIEDLENVDNLIFEDLEDSILNEVDIEFSLEGDEITIINDKYKDFIQEGDIKTIPNENGIRVISQIQENLNENNDENQLSIDHDEIEKILANKKEKYINIYLNLKNEILNVDENISYKIKKDSISFYNDLDEKFATMRIERDNISVNIFTNELNDNKKIAKKSLNDKNMYKIDIIDENNVEYVVNLINQLFK
jgi:predicted transport protein